MDRFAGFAMQRLQKGCRDGAELVARPARRGELQKAQARHIGVVGAQLQQPLLHQMGKLAMQRRAAGR